MASNDPNVRAKPLGSAVTTLSSPAVCVTGGVSVGDPTRVNPGDSHREAPDASARGVSLGVPRAWDTRRGDTVANQGAAPSTNAGAPARAGAVLGTLIVVAAIANLPLAVANVALPDIGLHFDASQTQLNLVAVGYSLGLAASVLWLGALGDRYGRKSMLLLGVAISLPASLPRGVGVVDRGAHLRPDRRRARGRAWRTPPPWR